MSKNVVKDFFDSKAELWDENETITSDKIEYLLKKLPIKKGDFLLDVGCGTGVITKKLNDLSNSKVIGIDLSSEMIKRAKEKYKDTNEIEFINADFLETNYKDADGIIIYNAYPHFLDLKNLKNKINHTLKEGGFFAVLHSLSRSELSLHHKNVMNVSRNLMNVDKEIEYYKDSFNLLDKEDDEKRFFFVLIKK